MSGVLDKNRYIRNRLFALEMKTQQLQQAQDDYLRNGGYLETVDARSITQSYLFVELLRRGYDTEKSLFYYRSRNDKETDFVTRNGNRIESLIQVCYDLSSPKTEKREVDSLIECAGELKCDNLYIITWDEERTIEKDGYVIQVVPVMRW